MRAEDRKINEIGMISILIINLGYVFFGSSFAQLRMQFSFLDFPIFIGEIVLVATTILFFVKKFPFKKRLSLLEWALVAYFIFILYKAFSGYLTWGPLAFRDAALFYYPFFAILGYSFWTLDLWGNKTRRFCLIMIVLMLILKQINMFWTFSLLLIGVIFSLQAKSVRERIFFIVLIVLLAPYGALFTIFNRTIFLSTSITLVFLGFTFVLMYCKNRRDYITAMVIGMLVLGGACFKMIHSPVWATMNIYDMKIFSAENSQDPSRGKFLFHPVGQTPDKPDVLGGFWAKKCFFHSAGRTPDKPDVVKKPLSGAIPPNLPRGKVLFHPVGQTPGKPDTIKQFLGLKPEGASLNTKTPGPPSKEIILSNKKADSMFRLIIWRDMLHEYIKYKPFFGFAFGRPLYSRTLKYYGLNGTEECDGWVGAHNSFFYMIYRSGIVGVVMVFLILFLWFGLLRDFYLLKDHIGILLCGILLNWIVSANFFLIFELPYTAIPVWTIWGITEKYRTILIRLNRMRKE